ncbi:glutathione S-transferase family protein [Undibacterium sp.]|uniref:glutathione S-transferase family protein n=1 Tax=Undibacterium sp. TaxID=1914977 RepID=UPI0025D1BAD9|nr:glutathione S-transferase family protein [Undibacterium sp.]
MLLYGSTDSGHSYKIRAFLLLTASPHEYQWIDLALPAPDRLLAFVAASKFGEVPVLLDQGRAMCQSNAILMYLAQRVGKLAGAETEWQGVLEWLSWESNRIGFSLPNLRYALRWSAQPPEVLHYLRQRVLADLARLDAAVSAQDFLLPSGPSIADLSCSAYLFWLDQVGIDESAYPHLQRWLTRLRALPHWQHPDLAMQAVAPDTSLARDE